jgi:hypothetical protein
MKNEAYFNKPSTISEVRSALRTVKECAVLACLAVANSEAFLPILKTLEKL